MTNPVERCPVDKTTSSQMVEIGSCAAILSGISTKVDGSIKVTLEINPEDQDIISRLMQRFAINEKLLQVGFISVSQGGF